MRDKLWMQKMKGGDLTAHHRRLREAHTLIDSSSPPVAQRSGRLARERERKAKAIEAGNKHFLQRLAKVIQSKNIDNDPVSMKAMSGAAAKKRALQKVQRENAHMLHRLQHAEKTYSVDRMRKEEARRQVVLKRMNSETPPLSPARHPPKSSGFAMDAEIDTDRDSQGHPNYHYHSPIARPSSSSATMRASVGQAGAEQTQQRKVKKSAWQGTAIALSEQDTMHLHSDITPLRARSPVFAANQKKQQQLRLQVVLPESTSPPSRTRPQSATGCSSWRPRPLPFSPSAPASPARSREMKRIFSPPKGAYMSSKI